MLLRPEFIDGYRVRPVDWGFPSGPNSLGEVTFRRTYSREGEAWWQTDLRVVEGTFDILRQHCLTHSLPFDEAIARQDAEEMYDAIFNFRWTPPGRGLWMMGTDFVRRRGGAALNNCGFVSTKDIDVEFDKPFRFLMDMSMLGVGVGFDTRGASKLRWAPTNGTPVRFVIPDSREGWVESLGMKLRWAFGAGPPVEYDDSFIRLANTPIRGFGGVASGPGPLKRLLQSVDELANCRANNLLTSKDIVDLMNFIGVCVVAGNVRRTAEIAYGDPDDESFLDLKDYDKNPDRAAFGWTSNNSIFATVGMDYGPITDRIRKNGEPGLAWLDNMRAYSRMKGKPDHKDHRVMGGNPCQEQSLEPFEMCCLVETYPSRNKNLTEFKRTLKYAYLYAKAVTLLPTHWIETNAVMLRNRRIGTSISGVVDFLDQRGEKELVRWCEEGYKTLEHYDRKYSEWLCVRESIKKTSVKPSGSVSLLAGVRPSCHWAPFNYYIRRIRYSSSHPDLSAIQAAGYHIEPAVGDPATAVISFPVKGPAGPTEREISLGRKVHLAALLQRHWADNQVSCTATFDPDQEGHLIPDILRAYERSLKGISFLPLVEGGAYPQMPYEAITEQQYVSMIAGLKPIFWPNADSHAAEDKYCDGTSCDIQTPAAV